MVVARVVYKNKSGWKSGKHAFLKAETLDRIDEYARKQARGREYMVQMQDPENAIHFGPHAQEV